MPNTPTERRIALFLDFENLVTNTGITPSSFDLQPSLDRLLERGKVIYRRAYCDWSRFREAKGALHEQGVELVEVPPSTRAGKNAADMRLVIDALELCYAREHIDAFAIASGDSDFCPLVYKLRENDRHVIGLGVRNSTSPLLVRACDEFLYLGSVRSASSEERPARTGGGKKERGPEKRGEVPALAREVVVSLLARATGPLNPSFIKEALVRKKPDFDERDYGFSSFSRMLESLGTQGLLKLQQLKGRQWYVLPPDSPPEGAAAHDGPAERPQEGPAESTPPEHEEESIPDPDDLLD